MERLFPCALRFRRGKPPHWEVVNGRYVVTFRLGDSLPKEAVDRLRIIQRELENVRHRTDLVERLQRSDFLTMEKYLNAGLGGCVLREDRCAAIVRDELEALSDWQVEAPHYVTIMPNHVHALTAPEPNCSHALAEIMKRFKGRSAHRIRAVAGGAGPVWPREWYDRWMRHELEEDRVVDYIRQNPVKAGLATQRQNFPRTKSK